MFAPQPRDFDFAPGKASQCSGDSLFMHQSFVTTAPPPMGMGRDSGANVWGSDLLSSPAVPGKSRDCDIHANIPQ